MKNEMTYNKTIINNNASIKNKTQIVNIYKRCIKNIVCILILGLYLTIFIFYPALTFSQL